MCVSLDQSAAALRASQKLALWGKYSLFSEWSMAYCERNEAVSC